MTEERMSNEAFEKYARIEAKINDENNTDYGEEDSIFLEEVGYFKEKELRKEEVVMERMSDEKFAKLAKIEEKINDPENTDYDETDFSYLEDAGYFEEKRLREEEANTVEEVVEDTKPKSTFEEINDIKILQEKQNENIMKAGEELKEIEKQAIKVGKMRIQQLKSEIEEKKTEISKIERETAAKERMINEMKSILGKEA